MTFRKAGSAAKNIWNFTKEIALGEFVFVPRGGDQFYVAQVTGHAFHDPSETTGGIKRSVRWLNRRLPISRVDEPEIFSRLQERPTCYEVSFASYPHVSLLVPALIKKIDHPPKARYFEKLGAMRNWLIQVARARGKVTYGHVMLAFDIDRFSLRHAMDSLGHEALERGEPIITALIVSKATKRCSEGLEKEFGVGDDQAEREKLYEYWKGATQYQGDANDDADASLEARAAQFASVESRPEQAAFRRRVYLAWGGRCAVSGCDVRRALDAAHKHGRDWRSGHNKANDGILLRKDLHALYDADMLRISDDLAVSLSDEVSEHYGVYAGRSISREQDLD